MRQSNVDGMNGKLLGKTLALGAAALAGLALLGGLIGQNSFGQGTAETKSTLAAPAHSPKPFDVDLWHVPETYGTVKEAYRGKKDRTIIYIQDAHCNFEAQNNNSKILQDLISNYGVHLVAVEGSSGIIDTTPFAQFPDKDIKTEVATYFMKKGRITGPEFLSITSDLKFTIFGIEDEKMYKINYDAFIKSIDSKDAIQKAIGQFKGYAEILKANIYSPELKGMDKALANYKANKMAFSDFTEYLAKSSATAHLDLKGYPNFLLQQEAKKLEAKIDFKGVDKERTALIGKLEKTVSKKQISDLVVKSLSFRMGKVGAEEFYTFLKNLAAETRVDMSPYKNLVTYIAHLKSYGAINTAELFLECDRLAEALQEKLFTGPEQRELVRTVKDLSFLDDLFELKLSCRDLDYFRMHSTDLLSSRFVKFFQQYANRYGIPNVSKEKFEVIDHNFSVVEDFYETAKKRDHILIENTVNKMDTDAQGLAVLVTGGFHTSGITEELKRRGFSFVVVTPRITDLNAENYYIDVMTNKKTPFEELLGSNEGE